MSTCLCGKQNSSLDILTQLQELCTTVICVFSHVICSKCHYRTVFLTEIIVNSKDEAKISSWWTVSRRTPYTVRFLQKASIHPTWSFRSIHVKKLKKNHTNLVVVSSWSVETPWFGTWVIFRLQEIDSSFENRRRRSLRKESAKIQVFNRHHYRSWYVRYVVDIIWTLCAWYDDLWNELNDILIIFS